MKKIYNPAINSPIKDIFNGNELKIDCGQTSELSDDAAEHLVKKYPWLLEVNNFVPTNFRSDNYEPEIKEFKKYWEKFGNNIKLLRNERANKFIVIGNIRYEIPNPETRNALGYDVDDFPLDNKTLDDLTTGAFVTDVTKARLIRAKDNSAPVYAVFNSPIYEKRHVPDPYTLEEIKRKQDDVEWLDREEFDKIITGKPLRSVKEWSDKKIQSEIVVKKEEHNKKNEILELKPGYMGISVDLKALYGKLIGNRKRGNIKHKPKKNIYHWAALATIVVGVVTLLGYFFKLSSWGQNLIKEIITVSKEESFIDITPQEIVENWDKFPNNIQAKSNFQNFYYGKKVKWVGKVFNITTAGSIVSNNIVVSFDNNFIAIFPEKFENLSLINNGDTLSVTGTINDFTNYSTIVKGESFDKVSIDN